MKSLFSTLSLCLLASLVTPALAADPAAAPAKPAAAAKPAANASANMQILLDKVKADKKLLVASNISLTDEESKVFWPIYDAYQKDLGALNDRLGKGIVAYAEAYNAGSLTDETANKLINEAIAVEEGEALMRKNYAAKLSKALPAKKAALYLQVEGKIRAAVRWELAKQIPLVQ
jgi:hypothetical protein